MKNFIFEYELYKNKASLLELELLKIKISYQDLMKDINAIVKEMKDSSKNPEYYPKTPKPHVVSISNNK